MEALLFVLAFVLLDGAAHKASADSRDGRDWSNRSSEPHGRLIGLP